MGGEFLSLTSTQDLKCGSSGIYGPLFYLLARLLGLVANLVSYRLKPSKIGGESLSKPPRLRNLVHCSTELNTNLTPADGFVVIFRRRL